MPDEQKRNYSPAARTRVQAVHLPAQLAKHSSDVGGSHAPAMTTVPAAYALPGAFPGNPPSAYGPQQPTPLSPPHRHPPGGISARSARPGLAHPCPVPPRTPTRSRTPPPASRSASGDFWELGCTRDLLGLFQAAPPCMPPGNATQAREEEPVSLRTRFVHKFECYRRPAGKPATGLLRPPLSRSASQIPQAGPRRQPRGRHPTQHRTPRQHLQRRPPPRSPPGRSRHPGVSRFRSLSQPLPRPRPRQGIARRRRGEIPRHASRHDGTR